jgi:hypothetical protein
VYATADIVACDLSSLKFSMAEENRVIFIDGVFSKSLSKLESLAEGLVVGSLSAYSHKQLHDLHSKLILSHSFEALNGGRGFRVYSRFI